MKVALIGESHSLPVLDWDTGEFGDVFHDIHTYIAGQHKDDEFVNLSRGGRTMQNFLVLQDWQEEVVTGGFDLICFTLGALDILYEADDHINRLAECVALIQKHTNEIVIGIPVVPMNQPGDTYWDHFWQVGAASARAAWCQNNGYRYIDFQKHFTRAVLGWDFDNSYFTNNQAGATFGPGFTYQWPSMGRCFYGTFSSLAAFQMGIGSGAFLEITPSKVEILQDGETVAASTVVIEINKDIGIVKFGNKVSVFYDGHEILRCDELILSDLHQGYALDGDFTFVGTLEHAVFDPLAVTCPLSDAWKHQDNTGFSGVHYTSKGFVKGILPALEAFYGHTNSLA